PRPQHPTLFPYTTLFRSIPPLPGEEELLEHVTEVLADELRNIVREHASQHDPDLPGLLGAKLPRGLWRVSEPGDTPPFDPGDVGEPSRDPDLGSVDQDAPHPRVDGSIERGDPVALQVAVEVQLGEAEAWLVLARAVRNHAEMSTDEQAFTSERYSLSVAIRCEKPHEGAGALGQVQRENLVPIMGADEEARAGGCHVSGIGVLGNRESGGSPRVKSSRQRGEHRPPAPNPPGAPPTPRPPASAAPGPHRIL